ncbi:binding-protein-dependent transport systems inner membrane component [Haloplasma contractile]|uniref:Binding-protein-dependent transport systems inner membrane component n=1 Tax=Haloplasma contractile SSD-17B TaxID=1033810 RepID=U2FK33_9MOLU|nr:binding-protein-dependent transport systems inner membrane component [Haloplasma contractile]ERJ13175.1 Binding-protein-dependent transport systems inner membrane component [Haloplasma contractile SSD-17B]
MGLQNYEGKLPSEKSSKNNIIGIVVLSPILIMMISFLFVPFISTFYKSFTNYNWLHVQSIKFTGLENYLTILLKDSVFKITVKNTFIIVFFSTTISVGISYLLAYGSSKTHKVYRYILSVLFLIGSLTFIIPAGLKPFFAHSKFSYIHLLFASQQQPINYISNPLFVRSLSLILPILLGLGPLYLLFTLAFMKGNNIKKTLRMGITLQIVLTFLSYNSVGTIVSNPSVNYMADTINTYALRNLTIRYEVGYASALLIINSLILAFYVIVGNVLVNLLMSNQSKNYEGKSFNVLWSLIIFIVLFIISLVLLYPFIQIIIDSFKPIDELFKYPQELLVNDPTLKNYKMTINRTGSSNYNFSHNLFKTFLVIAQSSIIMMILMGISSIGAYFLNPRTKRIILLLMTLSFVLTPIVLPLFHINLNVGTFNSVIDLIVKSWPFGVSMLLGITLFDGLMRRHNNLNKFFSSTKDLMYFFLGILSISQLASIYIWINPFHGFPLGSNKSNLFQLLNYQYHGMAEYGTYASLYVLSMIIPITIVSLYTPLLIFSYTRPQINKE